MNCNTPCALLGQEAHQRAQLRGWSEVDDGVKVAHAVGDLPLRPAGADRLHQAGVAVEVLLDLAEVVEAPDRARLRIQGAVPFESRAPVDPSSEYYAYKVSLLHAKTVGTGSCVGVKATV